jgi:LPXTG-site transpeptidase (sortase) family protein
MKKFVVVLLALMCAMFIAQASMAQAELNSSEFYIPVANQTATHGPHITHDTYEMYELWAPRGHRQSFCNDCKLPATGFSSRIATPLSVKPAGVNYKNLNMRIQIPTLDVDTELATVPLMDKSWAVEWLGDKAGLLETSAMPGEGVAVLAGHNTLNNTEYGPFALLSTLAANDMIFVTKPNSELMMYSVYANELLEPNDMGKLATIAGQVENALVLVTCENEAVEGGYLNRRVVFAAPL